ncbi:MAG: hypothetical protein ACREXJ_16535 [Gammaproteobacteria bacterium]
MDIKALANQYSSKTPEDILRLALESARVSKVVSLRAHRLRRM